MKKPTVLELCAGAGGQAVGLEQAGFDAVGLVEIDHDACETLRTNRPSWRILEMDLRDFSGKAFAGVDLVAAGAPCPPFSIAGRQLGADDERDVIPHVLRIVAEAQPRAFLLENVKGLAGAKFADYRRRMFGELRRLGYEPDCRIVNSSDHGVPQLRPRFVVVAFRDQSGSLFEWPEEQTSPPTVGATLFEEISSLGWRGAAQWRERASDIAPTIVGGSKKHGGPDLGPTRAKAEWRQLGVDAHGVASEPPGEHLPFDHNPKLTVPMVALLQGFPRTWAFYGRKTSAYRQVGNAFPPPVAKAIGQRILARLAGDRPSDVARPRLLEKSPAYAAG